MYLGSAVLHRTPKRSSGSSVPFFLHLPCRAHVWQIFFRVFATSSFSLISSHTGHVHTWVTPSALYHHSVSPKLGWKFSNRLFGIRSMRGGVAVVKLRTNSWSVLLSRSSISVRRSSWAPCLIIASNSIASAAGRSRSSSFAVFFHLTPVTVWMKSLPRLCMLTTPASAFCCRVLFRSCLSCLGVMISTETSWHSGHFPPFC